MNNEIGANIVKYRKLNGMSQKYLAKALGLSSQGLFKIEKGLASPKSSTVLRICEALCITPNQLFGLEEIVEDNVSILTRLRRMQEQ